HFTSYRWYTLIVSRFLSFSLFSLSSFMDIALGSMTSSSSRWPMSAPSMKKRRSRNMMSIIGIRLGFVCCASLLFLAMRSSSDQLPRLSGAALFLLGLGRQIPRQDVADRVVHAQRDVLDLVLHEEVRGQEDDRDEQAHRRVHQRLVH